MHKMKRSHYVTIVGFALLLCVAGCASLSTDPRLVGAYSGANSETLIFMPDARVFHTQIVNGKEEQFFLGYYVTSSSNPGSLLFVGPDTSRFLGTSFSTSDDFSTVTASWNYLRQPKHDWQVSYHKKPRTN